MSFRPLPWLFFLVLSISAAFQVKQNDRRGKLISLFEIIRFKNERCNGDGSISREGICYTAKECQERGGENAGSCASGFGVCCTFSLACGQSGAENGTYIYQRGAPEAGLCSYQICKTTDDVCRIRLDFETFIIAGPSAGTTTDWLSTMDNEVYAGAVGDCVTDTFTLTSPGRAAPPLICGFNSRQHMIVDASDDCHQATFHLGADQSVQRQWSIKVTQFECGNEMGGPCGCLQYFTGQSGNVASFNFPTNANVVDNSTTHLSNQHYTACFRQELRMCGLCFIPAISASASFDEQASFGLSVSSDTINANGRLDMECTADFLEIPNAINGADFQVGNFQVGNQRICGRAFNTLSDDTLGVSVCTQTTPFRLTFKSDANEVTDSDMANGNEQDMFPGGIIGFNLNWRQIPCQETPK